MKNFISICVIMVLVASVIGGVTALIVTSSRVNKEAVKKERQAYYEAGYLQACKDYYQNKKFKYQLVDNVDGTREWKNTENHYDLKIKPKSESYWKFYFGAWDDKNYFWNKKEEK